jgi:hypothetical protein
MEHENEKQDQNLAPQKENQKTQNGEERNNNSLVRIQTGVNLWLLR